ncbi:MAG: hypothetical protein PHP48_11290, partial [Bacteroidales bacterium]|nr:hypothetical protein [Bacteroidales bacterium]
MKNTLWLLLIFWLAGLTAYAEENLTGFSPEDFRVSLPEVLVSDVNQQIEIRAVGELFGKLEGQEITAVFNGEMQKLSFERNLAVIKHDFPDEELLTLTIDGFHWQQEVTPIPLWMSLLPPLIAIL